MQREAVMWFGDDDDFETCGLDPSKFTEEEKTNIRQALESIIDGRYQNLILEAAKQAVGATMDTHGMEG